MARIRRGRGRTGRWCSGAPQGPSFDFLPVGLRTLVENGDPALAFVVDELHRRHALGEDPTDPDVIESVIRAGRVRHAEAELGEVSA